MNILLGYDGSEISIHAMEVAKKHAKAFEATVHVVTSMEGGPEVPREDFERTEEQLRYATALIRKDGIPCKTRLSVRGLEPGEDLVQYAKENRIDEIIVGIKKRSKVGKLVFGSTAQYVILEAPCPVISVQ